MLLLLLLLIIFSTFPKAMQFEGKNMKECIKDEFS
jgi:hypothetical protein